MNRRRFLAATGLALSPPLVGCLESGSDPGTRPATDTPTDTTTPTPTGTTTAPVDRDDYSIDGRLHNQTSEPRTFTVTVTDGDDTVLSDGEQTVGPTGSYPVPAVGKPGATQTFTVTVENTSTTETVTFDVERTPEKVDGYVDITYTTGSEITIEFTPLTYPHDTVVTPDQRVDTPPYEINLPDEPENPGDGDDWNEHYLGEHIPTSPSIEFTTVTRRKGVLPLRQHDFDVDGMYWAELIVSEQARDARLDLAAVDGQTRDRLMSMDFEESVLLAIETGYGSGSLEHQWERVEQTDDGVHLHGYYTNPYMQTDDLTTHVSLIEIPRPADEIDIAHVSLTTDQEQRVHFNSTEGVVTLD